MSVCVPSFSVLAAATFSPHTRETPDLLSCCKKFSPINRHLLSPFPKRKKPVHFKMLYKRQTVTLSTHCTLYRQRIFVIFFLLSALEAEIMLSFGLLLPPVEIVVRLIQQSHPLLL